MVEAPTEKLGTTLAECLEELDRLVRAGALEVGSRGYALLSYLIDHHLKVGPDVPVKAYSIAVDVLDRPSSFDPTRDSIVRVEVGRLRKLLEMYFRGPGGSDPILFAIPRGQSHLVVVRRGAGPALLASASQAASKPVLKSRWSRPAIALIAVPLTMAFVMGFGLMRSRSGGADVEAALAEEFPRLFVQPFEKHGKAAETFPRNALSSFLATELSGFKTFRVIGPSFPSNLPIRTRDYILEGTTLQKDPSKEELVDLRLTVKDGFGTVLWADTLHFNVKDRVSPVPVLQAVSGVASTLGGAMGVIDTVGRARLYAERVEWNASKPSEFHCIMMWQSYDLTKGHSDRSAARQCLQDLADEQSRVSQTWAALGFSLLLDWIEAGADPQTPEIQSALGAASRAVLLDPEGADGHESLGSILTALGRLPEARNALEKAKQINPSNLDTIVKLGWLDCLEGDWDTGRERIDSVVARYSVVPGWYRLPLALSAFRDGDPAEMLRQSNAIIASGDQRGLALAVVAARLIEDSREEELHMSALQSTGKTLSQVIDELGAIFPDADLMGQLLAQVE
jgi:hypothetical protein